jgi:hypothetical protein
VHRAARTVVWMDGSAVDECWAECASRPECVSLSCRSASKDSSNGGSVFSKFEADLSLEAITKVLSSAYPQCFCFGGMLVVHSVEVGVLW